MYNKRAGATNSNPTKCMERGWVSVIKNVLYDRSALKERVDRKQGQYKARSEEMHGEMVGLDYTRGAPESKCSKTSRHNTVSIESNVRRETRS